MTFRTLHLVDPELRPLAEYLSTVTLTDETLDDMRTFVQSLAVLDNDIPKNVKRSQVQIPLRGGRTVRALLYQNTNTQNRAAMMHIHGGGLVSGAPEINDSRHLILCRDLGLTILAPTYRVAPEHPYPAPLNDCLGSWQWFHKNASDLNIDSSRIALSGDSAGGCLAASLSQRIRDRGSSPIAHLMLIYPMLNADTGAVAGALDPVLGEFGWTAAMNQFGWSAYLGSLNQGSPAVPGALANFANLPSCSIYVGALDLFLDENIKYARNLIAAGVSTELKVYPGAIHGFPLVSEAQIAQDFLRNYTQSLYRALELSNE